MWFSFRFGGSEFWTDGRATVVSGRSILEVQRTSGGRPRVRPETKYALSGDVHVAYQVFGDGDLDLVMVNGFTTHVELVWEHEPARRFLEGLASFARVINFDRRGSGLSDPVADAPTLEQRMDDVRAVMDAAGSQRAALLGISEGASMSILFAATYPDRVQALVCSGGMARSTAAPDYPWASPVEALLESGAELISPHWGEGAMIDVGAPSQWNNPESREFFGRLERASASPGMLGAVVRMFFDIDVRDVVPNVRTLGEIEEFLTGARQAPEPERRLATVLFTDIVDSTRTAAELGDQRWREVLEHHQLAVRDALASYDGSEVKSIGDGFLATFDGPGRAIRCARAIVVSSDSLGISVRAGLHTGECEVMGDDIGGIAVHTAARVSALAGPGEVLVSRTVKDLVAGSGIEFSDRGVHSLKGVPDSWQLYAVVDR
jgi:class 3 adenylate cyclase